MTDYRAIAASETQPDAPVTSTLMTALACNPLGIAEGADGAPRVSPAAQGFTAISGTAIGSLTVSGFLPYEGTRFDLHYDNTAGGSGTILMSLSTDNVTFSTPTAVAVYSGNASGSASILVDFATGDFTAVSFPASLFTGTTPAASASVTHVRFTLTGTGTVTMVVLASTNAGNVA